MQVFNINASREITDVQLLRCWQIIIPWLIGRAKRYHVICEPQKEGSSEIITLLTKHAASHDKTKKKMRSKLIDKLLHAVSKEYRTPLANFYGVADNTLADILLLPILPDEALPADIAPCQQVILYRNDDVLFALYDYGVFQTLNLFEDEVCELKNKLRDVGLPKNILIKGNKQSEADKAPWVFMGKIDK